MNEELKVIISAETSKLSKALNDAAKETENYEKKTTSVGEKIKKAFSAMGDAAKKMAEVAAKAIAVGGGALAAFGTSALNAYADYEQLTGGVEKLFGNSADTIKKYAEEAYKTAGVSANTYMEQITSFSASLIGSLDGDTAKAAADADMAIRDMADNANVFGTSIESIQNAYQGFAKQNYTMLDNLKLGYGGTKTEMERLLADASQLSGIEYDISNFDDIINAIHIVQDEMKITGTTAKEGSETISGSINQLKASWDNFKVAMVDGEGDIDTAVSNVVKSITSVISNIAPKIPSMMKNIVKGITELVKAIVPQIAPLLQTLLPELINGAVMLIQGLVAELPTILQALLAAIPVLIDGIVSAVTAIVEELPSIIEPICAALPTLIPQLLQGIIDLILLICENFSSIIQPIIDMLPDLITNVVDTLIENLPALIDGVISLVLGIVGAVDQIIEKLLPMIPDIIIALVGAIIENIPRILEGIWEILKAISKTFADYAKVAWENVKKLWEGIKEIFSAVGTWFNDKVIKPVADFFKGLWDGIVNGVKNAWEAVKNAVKGVYDWINKHILEPIRNAFRTVINGIIGFINALINGFAKGINAVIGALNKIQFDVPDWVPGIGGKHIGIDIKQVEPKTIPLLARGGVVDKPTLNIVGEAGAEAIVPLENNLGWLDKLAGLITQKTSTTVPIVLQVDGKTFAQVSIDSINNLTRQTGNLGLVLA